MKKLISKKIIIILSLTLVILNFAQLPIGYTAEIPSTDGVLAFLKDVVQLDMTKYNATLVIGPIVKVREDLGGLINVYGKYALKSETSEVNVIFNFINGTLCSCQLYFTKGLPQYSQTPKSSIADEAKFILQRHQSFTGDSSLNAMSQMLDGVDATENSTKQSTNSVLDVFVTAYSNSLTWKNTFNGAVFSSLTIGFQNGFFYVFGEDMSYFRLGSTEVNISKDGAVSLALERASGYSWSYGGQSITNFTIQKSNIYAELLTKAKFVDKPLELYPYWLVTCPLDGYYPGFVTMIMVEVWADTSEVIRVYPLGTGGGPSTEPSTSPSMSYSPMPSASVSPSDSVLPSQSVVPSASPASTPEPSGSSSSLLPSVSPSLEPIDGDGGSVFVLLVVGAVFIVVFVGVVVWRRKIK